MKTETPTGTTLQDSNNSNEKHYCRSSIENMKTHEGAIIAKYGRAKEGTIKLDVGEGDIPTPDFIIKAATDAMNNGDMFYGPVSGSDEMKLAVSDYYQRIYGLNIDCPRIFITPSGTAAVHYSLSALVDVGDEVVAVTPLWRNLLGAVDLQQGITKEVALDHDIDKGWTLDLDKLFAACSEKTRVIIINSPNNPTGWMMSKEDMAIVMDYARNRGIWIVSDEVYSRLVFTSKRSASFLDVAKDDDRLLVVNSFSKNWCMTGWRLGWITGPARITEKLYNVALYSAMGPSPFIQKGGIAALNDGEEFLEHVKNVSLEGREYVYERFNNMGNIIATKPDATFYSFFKIKGIDDCVSFARKLIDKKSLIVAPGYAFSKKTKGYMRLCYAVPRKKLEDAMDRLEDMISRH